MAEGKLPEACDAFRRSNELEARVGTLLNLADCEEKRGRIATAWATFIEARGLAKRENDNRRVGEADKRAAALAPQLPYLTIKTVARPAGFVVRRNGLEIPAAELDHEVPVDPGPIDVEASAPGHKPWKTSVNLAAAARSAIEVPALEVDASAPPPADTAPPTVTAPVASRRFGAGAAIGASTDQDVIVGVRGLFGIASLGSGSLRLVPSVFYTRYSNPTDSYQKFDLYAVGIGAEYVTPPLVSQFFVAGGLGFGVDIINDSYDNPLQTNAWAAARVSPTFRAGPVDIGLHFQLVVATRVVGLGELGVDYIF